MIEISIVLLIAAITMSETCHRRQEIEIENSSAGVVLVLRIVTVVIPHRGVPHRITTTSALGEEAAPEAVMDLMIEDLRMIIMVVMIGVEEVVMLMTGLMVGLDTVLEQDIKMGSLIWNPIVVTQTFEVAVHKEKG